MLPFRCWVKEVRVVTAASESFNSLDFSLLFTMIRRGVGNNFWGFGGSVLNKSVQAHLWCYHLSANLKLGYRSDWLVSSITFSQGPGTQPDVKYTAVSANYQKQLSQVNTEHL